MISDIEIQDPIADAKTMVDIFEASAPKVQRAMIKAFAMPIVSIEGFPENTFCFVNSPRMKV